MSFQTWIGVGNLTDDPNMRYLDSGVAKTTFSIAINEKYGEKERVTYVDVEAWDKLAERVAEYKRKGDAVLVQGRWQRDDWKDDDGNKKHKWFVRANDVRFLGGKRNDDDDERPPRRAPARQSREYDDSDLPF